MARLSLAHVHSFTQASPSGRMRGSLPSEGTSGTTVRLRAAMMSKRPLVVMKATHRPSGETSTRLALGELPPAGLELHHRGAAAVLGVEAADEAAAAVKAVPQFAAELGFMSRQSAHT